MADAVEKVVGRDFRACGSLDQAHEWLDAMGLHEPQESVGHAMVYAFQEKVEPTLIQPTLVYGHPVEISPLAKPMREDPRFAERFEIFIAGMECGDNWSEQNDPVALLEAWKKNYRPEDIEKGEFHPLDYDFIETLEHAMPPTTGIGPGLERMAMIFTEQQDIYDVIFFPMMKPHVSPVNRAIYGVAEEPEPDAGLTELVVTLDGFRALLDNASPDGTVRVTPHVRHAGQMSSRHVAVAGLAAGAAIVVAGATAEEVLDLVRARFAGIDAVVMTGTRPE
jgi:lysyl-tRNA synthetase class 2